MTSQRVERIWIRTGGYGGSGANGLIACDYFLFTDVEPFSKYSPVTLHLSPATRILNENPVKTV